MTISIHVIGSRFLPYLLFCPCNMEEPWIKADASTGQIHIV